MGTLRYKNYATLLLLLHFILLLSSSSCPRETDAGEEARERQSKEYSSQERDVGGGTDT